MEKKPEQKTFRRPPPVVDGKPAGIQTKSAVASAVQAPVIGKEHSDVAMKGESFLERGFGKPRDAENTMEACIRLCWAARTACQRTLAEHCLPLGGKHVAPAHVITMQDCIELTQVAADFMTRSSPLHTAVCSAAAIVADACADSCEALQPHDASPDGELQRCADACRACAIACREMAAQGVAAEDMHLDAPPSLSEEFPSINA